MYSPWEPAGTGLRPSGLLRSPTVYLAAGLWLWLVGDEHKGCDPNRGGIMFHQRSTGSPSPVAPAGEGRPAATLVLRNQPAGRNSSVAVDPRGTVIGRGPGSDLLLTSPGASRRHATVRFVAGEYVVDDLGSLNGTLLNGQPVTGPRALRDGDELRFGGVLVEFRRPGILASPPGERVHPENWRPDQATKPIDRTRPASTHTARHSLRDDLREAPEFSFGALLLAVLGSVVGAVLLGELQGRISDDQNWGPLAGAALGPVISATFTSRNTADKGRVRTAMIVFLSGGALLITANGFSIADTVAGRSILSSVSTRTSSLPLPGIGDLVSAPSQQPGPETGAPEPTQPETPGSTPNSGIRILTLSAEVVDCGQATLGQEVDCGQPVSATNAGNTEVNITGIEVGGDNRDDFIAGMQCSGVRLDPGDRCKIQVRFQPVAAGERTATLVVHHDAADQAAEVGLRGSAASDPDP